MKNLLCLLLILFVSVISHAQVERSIYSQGYENDDFNFHNNISIGITPSALMNRWMGFQGKLSYFYKKVEFVANAGYLSGSDQGDPYTGYRLRPTIKHHFAMTDMGSIYWGFGGLWRQLNVQTSGSFTQDGSLVVPRNFEVDESMRGLFAMFGVLIPFRNERFRFDGGVGFGNARINTTQIDVPEEFTYLPSTNIFSTDYRTPGRRSFLIFFVHLSLHVRI